MAEMSSATASRELRQAHARLKKARQVLSQARETPALRDAAFMAGWESLALAHRVMASIPVSAADDAVLTQQLSVQRYATALLVRLRRLARKEQVEGDDLDRDEWDEADDG